MATAKEWDAYTYTSSSGDVPTRSMAPAVFSHNPHEMAVPKLRYESRRSAAMPECAVDEFAFAAPLVKVKMFLHPSEGERAMARFRRLKRLGDNHDGEGAAAANADSVDFALSFLSRVTLPRTCLPTLSEEGNAVIEVHDRSKGVFADITFVVTEGGKFVQCYLGQNELPSRYAEGDLESSEIRDFLGDAVSVFYD